ncbi:MAG: phosphoribosylamine--glycine ligase, partial [Vampirovibrionia bacterium]
MKVLIIGSGGREHSIAWKISQSEKLSKLYCAPSNAGIDKIAERVNINVEDIKSLTKFAKDNSIDLTIVGPEVPLSLGIVDKFNEHNLTIFGPDKKGAQIESSKIFAKELMTKYNIPTANYECFDDLQSSINYLDKINYPVVVKYDGLAAGKGVTVCYDQQEAKQALKDIFKKNNPRVIIEEFPKGKEVSII